MAVKKYIGVLKASLKKNIGVLSANTKKINSSFYSTFSPSDLSGLVLWLKGDTAVYSDAGTTPAANNETIQQWNDQSGNSNHAKQATSNLRPTYKTNHYYSQAYIAFNGSVRFKVDNAANFDLANCTIFIVGRGIGTFTGKNTTAFGTGDNRRRKLQLRATNSTTLGYNSGSDSQSISKTTDPTKFGVMGIRVTGDSNHDFITGITNTNSTTALSDSTFNSASLEIGAAFDNGAESLVGEIAEIIIYNSALSDTNVRAVVDSLELKYGLPTAVASYTSNATWTSPSDVTQVMVELWGSGGKGAQRTTNGGGKGGGGGAYAKKGQLAVSPSTGYSVVIGTAGGTTKTSFNSTSVVADYGVNGTDNSDTAGGTGGTVANSTADSGGAYAGGNGANGVAGSYGGGGGEGASLFGTGNNGSTSNGGTGTEGANGGNGRSGTQGDGTAGTAPGGAGGGGLRTSGGTRLGGAGSAGKAVITYKIPN